MNRTFSSDAKKSYQKQIYKPISLENITKMSHNNLYRSPEKECSDINALVKESVDKINDLFSNKKLYNDIEGKKVIHSSFLNFKKNAEANANFTFNINNFINLRKEEKEYNLKNELQKNSINNTEINSNFNESDNTNNPKNKNNKGNYVSISHNMTDDNKNIDKLKLEDDLNEDIDCKKRKNSMIDISVLKRNIKKHSINIDRSPLVKKEKKEKKNQIDYIKQSNQNQKKYVIKNSFNLIENHNSNNLEKSDNKQNYVNNNPNKRRNYSFKYKSKNIKNTFNPENSIEKNNTKIQNKNNKYKLINLYKNNSLKNLFYKTNYNDQKNGIKVANSTKHSSQKNIFENNYKRFSSDQPSKLKEKRTCSKIKIQNNVNNKISTNNKSGGSFMNIKIQKTNQIKILPSTNLNKERKINQSKSQNHFNNSNNTQVLKQLYSKEFPSKIKTNDILRLTLFLNEYLINNNLLDDYYLPQNRQILEQLSKFLSSKIVLNYPKEIDISMDNVVNKTKIIQRFWRKRKIKKYLEKIRNVEDKELKKMIVNNYIEKSGFKTKKLLGLFHNMVDNFCSRENNKFNMNDNNVFKSFYYVQKIIMKDLTSFEKNELYKDYINKVIYKK